MAIRLYASHWKTASSRSLNLVINIPRCYAGWLGSRVVSMLDSGTERLGFGVAATTLSGNSLRQTVHTHFASVYQAAKLAAALLRIARVTAGLAESNGSLPLGLWLTSPAGWLPASWISSGTLRSVIEHGLYLPFTFFTLLCDTQDVVYC